MIKNIVKVVLILLLAVLLFVAVRFLYSMYGPQLSIDDIVPAKALVYGQLQNPVMHWENFEKSEFYKHVTSIDAPAVLKHNKFDEKLYDQFHSSYKEAVALMKNPVVGKLLGKEIAFAQYAAKDPKEGMVLITRSLASIQMAANMTLFLKDFGDDITVSKESVDGHVIMHLVFKQKKLSFKYAHIKNLLVFTDEKSTLIRDVIKTSLRKNPSIKSDSTYKEIAANFYPQQQGSLYVNIEGLLGSSDNEWATAIAEKNGLRAYGMSFLPGAMTKYKFLLSYDKAKLDEAFDKVLTCVAEDNKALTLIPPSAIMYHWGGCYQFADIATQLKSGAQAIVNTQSKRVKKSLEKRLASEELTDFMSLLGPEAGFYITDVDTQGLVPYPRILFFVKVKDADKAKKLLDQALLSNKALSLVANEDYNGNKIHYVSLPFGGNIDPGFTVDNDYLMLASSRQLLKKSMDVYKDPSKSIVDDKVFKSLGFNDAPKANGLFYWNIKEIAGRVLGVVRWYDRYLSGQIEMASTFKKQAQIKKKTLAEDLIVVNEELALAKQKQSEWRSKLLEELPAQEMESVNETIKNFDDQIKTSQQSIEENQAKVKEIDESVVKNERQVEGYKSTLYNASHVIVPILKGLQTLNMQGIKSFSSSNVLVVEYILN